MATTEATPAVLPQAGVPQAGVSGPAKLAISEQAALGRFLVDEAGLTLYLYTKDTPGTSNCYDKCAQAWPPLYTKGLPVAGAGVDAALLGTTQRKDGAEQVTYNGWPLYYYVKDLKAGDVTGQDVGKVWYVISPEGKQVSSPPAQAASGAKSGTQVGVAKDTPLGSILVDAQGKTLYLYTKDTPNTSNCYDKCAEAWPPLYTESGPAAGNGVNNSLLGTTQRKDGKSQVTYNGWPLYYYVKDQKPGDTTGQNVGGVWFVLSPKGEKMETGSGSQSQGQSVTVHIKDFGFGDTLTVAPGTTVNWVNDDAAPHTVTSDTQKFDSGNMASGATFKFTFTTEGEYPYFCTYHGSAGGNGMAGKVIVRGAQATPAASDKGYGG
jgi:predicted lipoprotein with Yx(FWY)xxD motif